MSDILNGIFKIKNSKPYIDYNNYHKGNIFGITKMSRRELMHSNFIAWMLRPDSSHALGFYPLYQLVRSLPSIQTKANNINARKIIDPEYGTLAYAFCDNDFILDAVVKREVPVVPVGSLPKTKPKYIDLLVEIKTKDKILPIVIENKVNSKENGDASNQTTIYFDWAEDQYKDAAKFYKPLYIYLYPRYNEEEPDCASYLRMTYQELVDYIIEPSMNTCGNAESIAHYRAYLQCLSFQMDNEKGGDTMAISAEEKKILEAFFDENGELWAALLNELDDIPEDVKTAATAAISGRRSQYEFEGKLYTQGRVILAVVQKWSTDNPGAKFADFEAAFPQVISAHKIVRNQALVKDHKRVFIKDPVVTDPDGITVVVNNQVTSADMPDFVALAAGLGYTVTKL